MFPVLQHPDDLLIRADFDGLNDVVPLFAFCAARRTEYYCVAIRQALGCLDVVEDDIRRQVRLFEFPGSPAFRIDFAHQLVAFIRDESVAIVKPRRRPRGWNLVCPDWVEPGRLSQPIEPKRYAIS